MKSFTSPLQTYKKEQNLKENVIDNILPTPATTISPIILQNDNLSESGGQQSQRCSMKKLCNIYLQLIGGRSPCEFNAKDLVLNTKIKQRRVYDLMNILQGCGYVKRISKGKYQSFNFDQAQQLYNNEQVNVQETSLSSMSFQVKKMLIQQQDFKPFKDICSEIFGLHVSKSVNLESLKRRIYQCCKVLKILGLVQKKGTSFKWKGVYAKAVANQTVNKRKAKSIRIRNKIKEKNKQTQWHMPIINIVLNKVQSETELNTFIETLRAEFQIKMQPLSVKRQLKYD